jgi:hypothetical protein
MRLWTLHPRYLDSKGLVAAWREALLAQKVLAGGTRGYTNHPQLIRFKSQKEPVRSISAFLVCLAKEARLRGYRFDQTKILKKRFSGRIDETSGQLLYEWKHLKKKVRVRAPEYYKKLRCTKVPESHPLFRIIKGKVQHWEKQLK